MNSERVDKSQSSWVGWMGGVAQAGQPIRSRPCTLADIRTRYKWPVSTTYQPFRTTRDIKAKRLSQAPVRLSDIDSINKAFWQKIGCKMSLSRRRQAKKSFYDSTAVVNKVAFLSTGLSRFARPCQQPSLPHQSITMWVGIQLCACELASKITAHRHLLAQTRQLMVPYPLVCWLAHRCRPQTTTRGPRCGTQLVAWWPSSPCTVIISLLEVLGTKDRK